VLFVTIAEIHRVNPHVYVCPHEESFQIFLLSEQLLRNPLDYFEKA